ncbi:class I SAM-dependent methyltransferase [Thermodesulfovibrio hydrogeniphilus]
MMNIEEIKRIKSVYEKRKIEVHPQLYSYFNPGNFFIVQSREREIINTLKKFGINSLENKKILDVGCGTGSFLRKLIEWGANPENLYGIDLLPDRIEQAKKLSPNINFVCGDASKLPYDDETFHVVMQFTVFTSIFDDSLKKMISKEMLRVLRRDGIILWYDFIYNNPKNPDVRGISRKEIINLFPNCEFLFKKITLAPPIARLVAPRSFLMCYLLELIPFLRTHYLAVIRKKENLI